MRPRSCRDTFTSGGAPPWRALPTWTSPATVIVWASRLAYDPVPSVIAFTQPPMSAYTLTLLPSLVSGLPITWQCQVSASAADRYVPQELPRLSFGDSKQTGRCERPFVFASFRSRCGPPARPVCAEAESQHVERGRQGDHGRN